MAGNDDRSDKNQRQIGAPTPNRFAFIAIAFILVLFGAIYFINEPGQLKTASYTDFLAALDAGRVSEATLVDGNEIIATIRSPSRADERYRVVIPYDDPELLPRLRQQDVLVTGVRSGMSPLAVILNVLPWIVLLVFIWMMFRQAQGTGNKAFSFGKSKAKRYLETGKQVSFADVAGQKEAKYELAEVVEFLKNPQKFTRMGAKIPKGVLLVGMPGTGKTLLAKAIAGEADVPFFHMSGSDFVEMFVGVGASRVRDLFEQGRKSAPCIIFIDELDAVGRTRGAGYGGGHDEREQTLNQMLVEMDGFETKDGVIIIAATNRPDVLDPALLRPGRFDRQVVVAMPDIKEREEILGIHARKVPLGPDVDIARIAKATPGTSGADLANLVNEAALFAARKNKSQVDMADFEEARDKLLMGVARRSLVITDEEKRATAIHEAGHALLHYYLKHADPLHKVTIIPHGQALGLALSLPEKEAYSRGSSWILDRIALCYGGYAAELLTYGETTTGAKNDLKQATELARKMVCEWGMAEAVGPISLGQEDEPIFLGKEIATHKDYSEETARKIDEAVQGILKEALGRAKQILSDRKAELDALAEALIARETLLDSDVRELLAQL
jgi:cell division protease FtsH